MAKRTYWNLQSVKKCAWEVTHEITHGVGDFADTHAVSVCLSVCSGKGGVTVEVAHAMNDFDGDFYGKREVTHEVSDKIRHFIGDFPWKSPSATVSSWATSE